MIFLFASALVINIIHGFLLSSQRDMRGLTISEHAARDIFTHSLYVFGHIVGGFLFMLFAYRFFIVENQTVGLFAVTAVGVFVEWAQAFVPAKNTYESIHLFFAYTMSVIMTALGFIATVFLDLPLGVFLISIAITLSLLAGYPLVATLPRKYFWVIEMININLFYLQIFLIYIAS
jgi:hypothetical protein